MNAVTANLVGPDLLIVAAVVFLLFGGKKLPELARSLGKAKKEFAAGHEEAEAAAAHSATLTDPVPTASIPPAAAAPPAYPAPPTPPVAPPATPGSREEPPASNHQN